MTAWPRGGLLDTSFISQRAPSGSLKGRSRSREAALSKTDLVDAWLLLQKRELREELSIYDTLSPSCEPTSQTRVWGP
jgi:hypothetical protein